MRCPQALLGSLLLVVAVRPSRAADASAGSSSTPPVVCGGPDDAMDQVPEDQRWHSMPDALSSRCNNACAGVTEGASLCVYRASADYECSSTGSIGSRATCVRGPICTYECIHTPPDATARWAIEWQSDASTIAVRFAKERVEMGALEPASTAQLDHPDAIIRQEVKHFDDLTLPSSVTQLILRGPGNGGVSLEEDSAVLSVVGQLDTLSLTNIDVHSWAKLPNMPNLKTLSLVNASLPYWPLDMDTPDAIEFMDLSENPQLQLSPGTFTSALKSLSLRHCDLTALPPDVSALESLQELNVDSNPLSDTLDTTRALPAQLRKVSLKDCGLTAVPTGIRDMQQLATIDLSHNTKLGKVSGNDLPLTTLQSLNLASCGLDQFPFADLEPASVISLDLSGNAVFPESFELLTPGSIHAMESIDLSNTKLTKIPAALAESTTLVSIGFAGNRLKSFAWPSSPLLTRLNISRCGLKSLPDDVPATLQELDISSNTLSHLPSSLKSMSALRNLDVSNNNKLHLESLPPQLEEWTANNCSLSKFPSLASSLSSTLRVIHAQDNKLTAIPSDIFKLTALRELNLNGNPFAPKLLFTESEFEFLNALDSLALDADSLETSTCSSPRMFASGHSVCVDSPGTVKPANESALANIQVSKNSHDEKEKTTDKGVNSTAMLIGSLIAVAAVLVAATLLFVHRRVGKKERVAAPAPRAGSGSSGNGGASYAPPVASLSVNKQASGASDSSSLTKPVVTFPVDDPEGAERLLTRVEADHAFCALWITPDAVNLKGVSLSTRPSFLIKSPSSGGPLGTVIRRGRLSPEGQAIAVKMLPKQNEPMTVVRIERLVDEIKTMSLFRHFRIVQLIGATWTPRALDFKAVLEWMPDGDLRAFLAKSSSSIPPPDRWGAPAPDVEVDPSPRTRPGPSTPGTPGSRAGSSLQIALDVVDALVYLHALPHDVQHRRRHWHLSSHRVLLDFTGDALTNRCVDAKLCDLAAAPSSTWGSPRSSSPPDHEPSASRWLAPELLTSGTLDASTSGAALATPASDIYAFGVLLWELDSYQPPFEQLLATGAFSCERDLLTYVARGDVGPHATANCPPLVATLMERCMASDPAMRPTARELARALRTVDPRIGQEPEPEPMPVAVVAGRQPMVQTQWNTDRLSSFKVDRERIALDSPGCTQVLSRR